MYNNGDLDENGVISMIFIVIVIIILGGGFICGQMGFSTLIPLNTLLILGAYGAVLLIINEIEDSFNLKSDDQPKLYGQPVPFYGPVSFILALPLHLLADVIRLFKGNETRN